MSTPSIVLMVSSMELGAGCCLSNIKTELKWEAGCCEMKGCIVCMMMNGKDKTHI